MSQHYRDHKMNDSLYFTLAQTSNTINPQNVTIFNSKGACTCISQPGPPRTEFAHKQNMKFWPIAQGNIGGWKNK